MEEKKVVQVFLILLKQELNIQKTFDVGHRVVSESGGTYGGLTVFTLANPTRDKHCISFVVDPSKLGSVVERITTELGLVSGIDYVVQAAPTVQLIPKARPPQTFT